MTLYNSDKTVSIWKEIGRDEAPNNNRLVLTAIAWGNNLEPDYGIGMFEDGEWWHTSSDDVPPTHWADFDRLPLSVSNPKLGDDHCLAIAGMKFPLEEICPAPQAPQMIIPVVIGEHKFPVDFNNPTAEVAHQLAALITEQCDGVEIVDNQIVVRGGIVTFAIAQDETNATAD